MKYSSLVYEVQYFIFPLTKVDKFIVPHKFWLAGIFIFSSNFLQSRTLLI